MQSQLQGKKKLSVRLKKQKYLWIMLFPSIVLVFLFAYSPLFGWIIAFKNYNIGKSIFEGEFTGLLQFRRFFTDSSDFGYLLQNTLFINITSIILSIYLALLFAILLTELPGKFLKETVQTVTFFPYFISWVLIYVLVYALFAVRSGVVNQFLINIGLIDQGFNILGDRKYSWFLMIFLNLWKGLGYNSIIFLATIKGISAEMYEASALDGATRFQRIKYITIPAAIPTVLVLLIMQSGMVFSNNIEQFFVFTNSTNWERMEVFDMYIYKFGMKKLDFPYATAVGIIKSIISFMVFLIVNKIFKKVNNYSILG